MKRGIYLLPNLCTTASLFCGFFAIVKALHHDFVAAAWGVLIAGVFDFLDGRVARLARAESAFGIEYDSLVDLASFGLAPGLLVYQWSLVGFPRIGWLVTFLFFACGALRLARFNVQAGNVERNYFQGLPIPAAAYLIATTVILYQHARALGYVTGPAALGRNWWALGGTIALAGLMVSSIRYRSLKTVDLRGRWSFFSLVVVVGLIFVIAAEPEITMWSLVFCYVAAGAVEELVTMRKGRQVLARVRARRAERRTRRTGVRALEENVHPLYRDTVPRE